MITQAPRGVQDWYGEEMYKRSLIEKAARELAAVYHMSEIITPMFEHTVLFARGVGETTDVVQKEMYTFEDKGGRSITLKPEGTAGVMRAYLEHNLYAQPAPVEAVLRDACLPLREASERTSQTAPSVRRGVCGIGKPAGGSGADLSDYVSDPEAGPQGRQASHQQHWLQKLQKDVQRGAAFLSEGARGRPVPDLRERMQKNPLRVLDCKVDACRGDCKGRARTIQYLDEECREHFEELKALLDELGIEYRWIRESSGDWTITQRRFLNL